ncbi:MAG: S1C family serine protease [Candidatus Poribacteria bacterium]|nr:S1C family serine protease [Candidatus Poribacteria bacterium]
MKYRAMATVAVVSAAAWAIMSTTAFAAYDWTADIERYKPSVVNIERSAEVVFETERQGTSFATGFIVDAERGIIATNRHVTGTSPTVVKINFYDGSFTEARVLYYDPTQDFAFYQIDPSDVAFTLQAVTLGSWRALSLGEELLLIGNNEKEEYSIKYGTVTNLNVNKGRRHGTYIFTTFDRTGGSSGSPVWNTKGQVIGIHAAGTDTSSFEVPVEYLIEALTRLQNGTPIQRGDIGADLELISIGEAVRHYGLPVELAPEIGPSMTGGTPQVIQVEGVIPRTTAEGLLLPGDIVYRAGGELLRNDLFLYDRILDGAVGGTVALIVYRNGEKLEIDAPVFDLEDLKIQRFARFAGGIFHDVTEPLRHSIYLEAEGVFMPFSVAGSTFSKAGVRDRENGSKVLITDVIGQRIAGLSDFIEAARGLENGQHGYLVSRDFNLYDNSEKPKSLTFNLQYGPLEVFSWDAAKLEWVKEEPTE